MYCFLYISHGADKENLFNNQELLHLGIIPLFSWPQRLIHGVILQGETRCWSPFWLKSELLVNTLGGRKHWKTYTMPQWSSFVFFFFFFFFRSTLEWLSNEGHIYSTIDDDHFRSTDSYWEDLGPLPLFTCCSNTCNHKIMTDYSCLAQIAEIQKHYASILK